MHFRETVIFLECRLQTKICYGYNNIAVYICPANAVCNIDSDVCGGPYLSFNCLSIGLCSNNNACLLLFYTHSFLIILYMMYNTSFFLVVINLVLRN